MTEAELENLDRVRRYLAALERFAEGEELAAFFAEDALQVEFPNRLNPSGQRSDLSHLLERSGQAKHLLSAQRYEVRSEVASGDRVAVEALWVGTLAVPIGELAAGAELRANFALFFELKEGRIVRQHNYDCFEPW